MPTILLAEDDSAIRESMVEILSLEGFEVVAAQNGREAIEKALNSTPDLVILDQRMPEMTGAEVFSELRANNLLVPVILISATKDVYRQFSDIGIHSFLGKPFTIDDLLATIARALGTPAAASQQRS